MEHFLLCWNGIGPLLVLILLGWFLKRRRVVPEEGFAALDKLSFRILIPAMLFCNVYSADFSREFYPGAVLFMELAIAAVFLAMFLLVPRLVPGRREEAATLVHGLCHGNLAVLGMPLMVNLFGQEQAAVYAILMACTSPLINPLMVFEHVWFKGDRLRPGELLKNMLSSPFLVGTLAGLFCNLAGLRLPDFLYTAVSGLRATASPLCLVALGGSFSFGGGRRWFRETAGCVLGRCVLLPAAVLGIAVALGFRGVVLASLLVIFCCPSAAATYSFCAGYCGSPELASQIVVYSTLFSLFSLFCWLFAFLRLGLL